MIPANASRVVLPLIRAISQFDDPAFRGIVLRSVAWSFACLAVLYVVAIFGLRHLLPLHGWLVWVADLMGSIAASLVAFWLFLPVAAAIGTLYFDRIARTVEQRYYPWLPRPEGASLRAQVWDGLSVALKVLVLNIAALVLALLLPGVGLILGWMIASYAIGRGLFVAVAMRRMPRVMAESLYRSRRFVILTNGAMLALMAYVPLLNLLIPILGIASMVHVMDLASARAVNSP